MSFYSIIVPVYNAGKYLDQCIMSVINQDFSDFELILVDDGSKDDSGEICDRYAMRDQRIHVIHQLNLGSYEARRTGVYNSSGKYIFFVDADDWLQEQCLFKSYEVLSCKDCDILIFDYQRIDANGKILKITNLLEKEKVYQRYEIINIAVFNNNLNNLCNKVIKSHLCHDAYNKPLINMVYGEDLYITLKILKDAKNIIYLDDCLYNYRYNRQSSTAIVKKSVISSFNTLYLEELQCVAPSKQNMHLLAKRITLGVLKSMPSIRRTETDVRGMQQIYNNLLTSTYFTDAIKTNVKFSGLWQILFFLLRKKCFIILNYYLSILWTLLQIKIKLRLNQDTIC